MADPRVKWSGSTSFTVTGNATYPALTIPPMSGLSASAGIFVHVTYNATTGVAFPSNSSPLITFADSTTLTVPLVSAPRFTPLYWANSSKLVQGGTLSIIAAGFTSQGPLAVSAMIVDGAFYGATTPQFITGTFNGSGTTLSFAVTSPWASGDLAIVASGDSDRPSGTPVVFSTSPAGDANWTVVEHRVSAVTSNGTYSTAVVSALLTFSASSVTSDAVISVAPAHEPIWMEGFAIKIHPVTPPPSVAIPSRLATIVG